MFFPWTLVVVTGLALLVFIWTLVYSIMLKEPEGIVNITVAIAVTALAFAFALDLLYDTQMLWR